MFIQKDLGCNVKPAKALDLIFYINGNEHDRFVTTIAFIDTMKRLNPRFADYINQKKKGVSRF